MFFGLCVTTPYINLYTQNC